MTFLSGLLSSEINFNPVVVLDILSILTYMLKLCKLCNNVL